jgi:UPF0755 protein
MRVATLVRRGLIGAVLASWLLGTAALLWLMLIVANTPASHVSRDVAIELPAGTTIDQLAARLAEAKAIDEPQLFAFYLRVIGAGPKLRTGWVVVNRALSMREHLPRLARGYGTSSVDVVVPEGFTRFDVATRLSRYGVAERDALLRASEDPRLLAELAIDADSAEGYLFPALYRFKQDSAPERVIARMVATFRAKAEPLLTAQDPAVRPLSPLTSHQLVTLASIVEREARVPEERPTIAGVFFNRLFDPRFTPKRLQADPTVAYGCLVAGDRVPSCRSFDGRHITAAMVRDPENPYSTYRHEGLPPGPICNPGLSSLEAARHPAQHPYFYFVAKGGGRHAFSASLDQHNQNVHPSAPSP